MSTPKKTSSKSSKSPAPATKSVKAKPVERKKAKIEVAAPVVAAARAPAKSTSGVAPVPSKPVQTVISARVDVGFGNALFIRGEGAGLSWDRGLAMDCIEADLWRVTLPESAQGHTFKFLVNDLSWSAGPDFSAKSGTTATLSPTF